MVGNDEQKNANTLPEDVYPNLEEKLDKQVSRFQTVEGTKDREMIQGIRIATCNQIFTGKDWDDRLHDLGAKSGIFTDSEFPATKDSLIGNVVHSNPELAK